VESEPFGHARNNGKGGIDSRLRFRLEKLLPTHTGYIDVKIESEGVLS
jgi:hypothetical protein